MPSAASHCHSRTSDSAPDHRQEFCFPYQMWASCTANRSLVHSLQFPPLLSAICGPGSLQPWTKVSSCKGVRWRLHRNRCDGERSAYGNSTTSPHHSRCKGPGRVTSSFRLITGVCTGSFESNDSWYIAFNVFAISFAIFSTALTPRKNGAFVVNTLMHLLR